MTQINAPVLPPGLAGLSPDQLQALLAFFAQNQNSQAQTQNASTGTAYSSSSSSTARSPPAGGAGNVQAQTVSQPSISTSPQPDPPHGSGNRSARMKTPPPSNRPSSPPPTPRTPANRKSKLSSSAALTPSSKLAQMTLEGEKSTPPQKGRGRKSTARKAQSKTQVPTGYDPALTYEAAPAQSHEATGSAANTPQEESDPFEGFPEIVTVPPKVADTGDKMDVDPPKSAVSRRKRNDPTTPRWINTRRTRSNSECSPPPVKRSPKKKARVASPTPQTAPSEPDASATTAVPVLDSAVDQPSQDNSMEIQILEGLLSRARKGEKISLGAVLGSSVTRKFVDDEAEEHSADDDVEDEDGDLDGFVVPDDVVEYDTNAPSLPDDDDVPLSRLRRRSRIESDEQDQSGDSEIEIVPNVDKGKRRADPAPSPPPSQDDQPDDRIPSRGPSHSNVGTSTSAAASVDTGHVSDGSASSGVSWRDSARVLSNIERGLYPGSSPVDPRATICPPIVLDDTSSIFSWTPHRNEFLDSIDFCSDAKPVPGDCALSLSDFNDDGWSMPSIDVVAAAETHVHVSNLKKGLKFRRAGPFINEATVDPSDIIAAQVSGPGSTLRYKFICKDTRAPAVSITPCVVRYTRLDAPSNGNPPLRYISVSPFDGLFDRMVGLECMKFGQRDMQCVSFNNAIRIATIPAFERPLPAPSTSRAKTSSSIRRGNNSGQSTRRASNFEPSTNDIIPVLDARTAKLPVDISTWTSTLPLLEGPVPKDAVALVAHTTNMWVGTRSKTAPSATTYNVQHNLIFIVVIGALPVGFV